MTDIIIFGGTSEGRRLAEFCAARKIRAAVSVATGYGESLLKETPWLGIHTGRMDREQMEAWLAGQNPRLVLDATHPYAVQATENIRLACGGLGLPLLRVLRGESGEDGGSRVVTVGSVEEAAAYLDGQEGTILVTTGSKELRAFASLKHCGERVFARVLPSPQALEACREAGILPSHILAMQGPFSAELNAAMIRQTGAAWLVTKESGRAGGFEEKLQAAEETGAKVVLVGRPEKESGVSLEEALKRLGEFAPAGPVLPSAGPALPAVSPALPSAGPALPGEPSGGEFPGGAPARPLLVLAGAGMGTAASMTLEVIRALRESQVIFGAPRLLGAAREALKMADELQFPWESGGRRQDGPELAAEYMPEPVFAWLERRPEIRRAIVLFSGDTGFYSGAAGFFRAAGSREWELRVLPGISSLAQMAAALGKSWEDAVIASRHGREQDVRKLAENHPKVFVLTGGSCRAEQICGELSGLPVTVFVGENLGSPEERIVTGKPEELAGEHFASLAVMWIEEDGQ